MRVRLKFCDFENFAIRVPNNTCTPKRGAYDCYTVK